MKSKRVMLVDDVEFNIEFADDMIRRVIEQKGVRIETDVARSVGEAISKIDRNEPYDAIVTDMNLPDGSGKEIAVAAMKKSEDTRLAALTIYPSKYENDKAYFDLFMRKPIEPFEYKKNFAYLLQI